MPFNLPTTLRTTQPYIPLVDPGEEVKLPGLKNFATITALAAAVAVERTNIAAGFPVWVNGDPLTVATEPGIVRPWYKDATGVDDAAKAAASHARSLSIGEFSAVLLGDENTVRSGRLVPAAGIGANGDLCHDPASRAIYLKAAGSWARIGSSRAKRGGLRIVGQHYFTQALAVNAAAIGGTCRKVHKSCGAISRIVPVVASHAFGIPNTALGATETTVVDGSTLRFNTLWKVALEYNSKVSFSGLRGQQRFALEAAGGAVQCDPVGIGVPAQTEFFVRTDVRPVLKPTAPAAVAQAGGALPVQTWYYCITKTQAGIESGPTAEFSATTTSGNQAIKKTWADAVAGADYYTVYRGAIPGAKAFLSRTNGPVKQFVDDGSITPDATIAPPASDTSYRYNVVGVRAGDGSSHHGATGDGGDVGGTAGTAGLITTTLNARAGTTVVCLLGDDMSGRSWLYLGTSQDRGSGFNPTSGTSPVDRNMWDVAVAPGLYNSLNAGINGATLSQLLYGQSEGAGRTRLALLQFADFVVGGLVVNDLALGATWSALAALHLTLAKVCYDMGVGYVVPTCLPNVATTTNGMTYAGQTPKPMEAHRVLWNNWVRGGCQVNGAGVPVQSGGTTSPYVCATIDLCTAVETNAAGVLTPNGGYWKVPTAAKYTGLALQAGSTATLFNITAGAAGQAYSNIGDVVKMTSGARNGEYGVIQNMTGNNAMNIYASGDTSQAGIAVSGLSGAPAAGDTFEIWSPFSTDGLHKTIAGHLEVGTSSIAPAMAQITGPLV